MIHMWIEQGGNGNSSFNPKHLSMSTKINLEL